MFYLKNLKHTAIFLLFIILIGNESTLAEVNKNNGYIIVPTFDQITHEIAGASLYYSIPVDGQPAIKDLKGADFDLSHVEEGCGSVHQHISLNLTEDLVKQQKMAAWYYGFTGDENATPPASQDIPCMSDEGQAVRTYVYHLKFYDEYSENDSEYESLHSRAVTSEPVSLIDADEIQHMMKIQTGAGIPMYEPSGVSIPGVVTTGFAGKAKGLLKSLTGKDKGSNKKQNPPKKKNQTSQNPNKDTTAAGGSGNGGDKNNGSRKNTNNIAEKKNEAPEEGDNNSESASSSRLQRFLGFGKAFIQTLRKSVITSGKTVFHVYAIGSSKYLPDSIYPKLVLHGAKLAWWEESVRFYISGESTATSYLFPYLEGYWDTVPGRLLISTATVIHYPFYLAQFGAITAYQLKVRLDQQLTNLKRKKLDKIKLEDKERKKTLDQARQDRESFEQLSEPERINRFLRIKKDKQDIVSDILFNYAEFHNVYSESSYIDPDKLESSVNFEAIQKQIQDKKHLYIHKVMNPDNREKVDSMYYSRKEYIDSRDRINDLLEANPIHFKGTSSVAALTGCKTTEGVRMYVSEYQNLVRNGQASAINRMSLELQKQTQEKMKNVKVEDIIANTSSENLNKVQYKDMMRFHYDMIQHEKDSTKKRYHQMFWDAFSKGASIDNPYIPQKDLDTLAQQICSRYSKPLASN